MALNLIKQHFDILIFTFQNNSFVCIFICFFMKNLKKHEHEHNNRAKFIISGMDSKVYPCLQSENEQVVKRLTQLLNSTTELFRK